MNELIIEEDRSSIVFYKYLENDYIRFKDGELYSIDTQLSKEVTKKLFLYMKNYYERLENES